MYVAEFAGVVSDDNEVEFLLVQEVEIETGVLVSSRIRKVKVPGSPARPGAVTSVSVYPPEETSRPAGVAESMPGIDSVVDSWVLCWVVDMSIGLPIAAPTPRAAPKTATSPTA